MQKKFLTNLGILLFLNLLVKPFWVLGIDRSVQNAVGAEDFGFYFSILNFSFLFNILLDFGITNFNNRNIAQNSQLLNKHFSSILLLKVLLGVGYMIITFLVGLIIGYDSKQFYILGWVALNQFLLSFILYLRSNISGLLLFKTDSIISVLDRLLMIIFCSILLWGNVTKGKFQIEWFVYAQTAAYLVTALIAITIVIRKAAFRTITWHWPFIVMILKKSLPFALLVLLMAQYNRIDSVVIERILPGDQGKMQAGIYAQAFRLLDATNMIAFLFSVLLLPLFSKMIKQNDSVENLVRLSFSLLLTVSVLTAAFAWFYSNQMMAWLYPLHADETNAFFQVRIEQSAQVFRILMFSFVAISTTYVFGTLLTANGSLKQLNIVAGVGVAISLIINLSLVPKLQAVGAAYASLSAQGITAIAQVLIAVIIFKFKANTRFLAALVFFIAGAFVIAWASTQLNFDWKINAVFAILSTVLLAVTLRLLNVKEAIHIFKTEKA